MSQMSQSQKRKGFASMKAEERSRIAQMGGRAAHRKGTGHEWGSHEAAVAGRRGGAQMALNRFLRSQGIDPCDRTPENRERIDTQLRDVFYYSPALGIDHRTLEMRAKDGARVTAPPTRRRDRGRVNGVDGVDGVMATAGAGAVAGDGVEGGGTHGDPS
jgi:hypothetical protein